MTIEQVWIAADCLWHGRGKQWWVGQAYIGDRPVAPPVLSHSKKSVRAEAYAALRINELSE